MDPMEMEKLADAIMSSVRTFSGATGIYPSPPEIYFALALVQAEFIRKYNAEIVART